LLLAVWQWDNHLAYCFRQEYWLTAVITGISGVTDIADGAIARKFHMVSNTEELLDSVADKLTQIAVVFCLSVRFTPMRILLEVQVIEEGCNDIVLIDATNNKPSASNVAI